MNKDEYRDCIVRMLNEIEDERQIKRIFEFIHRMFVTEGGRKDERD